MTILTAEEVRALAEAIERPSDRLAIYVAAYTGLRAGELWALQRRDVDLPGRRLLVGRTLQDERGHLTFSTATKTDASRRVVSLPTFLVNMRREHLAALPADADALLFTSPGGGPVRHSLFVRRAFKPAVQGTPAVKARLVKNGPCHAADLRSPSGPGFPPGGEGQCPLPRSPPHVRRAADRRRAPPVGDQDQSRPPSITTTMDRYGQLFPSAEAALADALDATYDAGNVTPLDVYASNSFPSA